MKTKNQKMYDAIEQHGTNLNKIFNTDYDSVTLCKKLFRLENKAHKLITDECNTGNSHHTELCKILTAVKKILFTPEGMCEKKNLYLSIFINGDARGYALKINDKYMRENNISLYRDWGGYGILAPDFTNV